MYQEGPQCAHLRLYCNLQLANSKAIQLTFADKFS